MRGGEGVDARASSRYWNSRRIAVEFRRRESWPLHHGQVDRRLHRYGSHRPSYARTPGPRYERGSPNGLWRIDLKGPFYPSGCDWMAIRFVHAARPCQLLAHTRR